MAETPDLNALKDDMLVVHYESTVHEYSEWVYKFIDVSNEYDTELMYIIDLRDEINQTIIRLVRRGLSINTNELKRIDVTWRDLAKRTCDSKVAIVTSSRSNRPKEEWWWWIDSLTELSREQQKIVSYDNDPEVVPSRIEAMNVSTATRPMTIRYDEENDQLRLYVNIKDEVVNKDDQGMEYTVKFYDVKGSSVQYIEIASASKLIGEQYLSDITK